VAAAFTVVMPVTTLRPRPGSLVAVSVSGMVVGTVGLTHRAVGLLVAMAVSVILRRQDA
jgi:hypothetical protein